MNRWKNGAIPGLLIHGSIGTVYCWSLLQTSISECIPGDIGWAFSLAIFFLGISAAFLGPLVERNVRLSSLLSAGFFAAGMILSGIACFIGSELLLYLGYGVIMGIGLGLGYLSPVKTLMMWFKNNKGLATGLAIAGFGLAKVLASPGFSWFIENYGIVEMFFFHGVFYFVIMLIGALLLRKPELEEYEPSVFRTAKEKIKDWWQRNKEIVQLPGFLALWAMFYLNITAGLAIIADEKLIFITMAISPVLGSILSAIFNSLGRLGSAWWSDYVERRAGIFALMMLLSMLSCLLGFIFPSLMWLTVLICNFGYGTGFAIMPSILHDRYGMKNVSSIHGLILSAWAFAGLSGNQLSELLLDFKISWPMIMLVVSFIYLIGLKIGVYLWKSKLPKIK